MKSALCIFAGIVLKVTLSAQVAPTPGTQNIPILFDQADLVCSCSIESSQLTSSERLQGEEGQHALAVANIDQLYKSNSPVSSTFVVEYDDGRLSKGERAVMFLKLTGPSVYSLADPSIGATPFNSFSPSTGTGLAALESALLSAAERPNRTDRISAMQLLQGFASLTQDTISRLVPLSNSTDPEIALAALAVLLKTGESEQVERLRTYLHTHRIETAPVSILSIGSELGQVRDELALSALDELSGSTLLSVRIGSMQALRAIKSPVEAECLIKRLGDSNGYVRYLAVMTLAETFSKFGDYAPSMDLFDRNPEFYLGLWKSWWATEGQAHQANPTKK